MKPTNTNQASYQQRPYDAGDAAWMQYAANAEGTKQRLGHSQENIAREVIPLQRQADELLHITGVDRPVPIVDTQERR